MPYMIELGTNPPSWVISTDKIQNTRSPGNASCYTTLSAAYCVAYQAEIRLNCKSKVIRLGKQKQKLPLGFCLPPTQ